MSESARKNAPDARLYIDVTGFIAALDEERAREQAELDRTFPTPPRNTYGLGAYMQAIAKVEALGYVAQKARDAAHLTASLSMVGRDYAKERAERKAAGR